MKLHIAFSPEAYAHWLTTFAADATVGIIPSRHENPLAHYIIYQMTAAYEVPLKWVAVDLFTSTPIASLAICNSLFVSYHAASDPVDSTEVNAEVRELQVHLPSWTMDLARRYTRGHRCNTSRLVNWTNGQYARFPVTAVMAYADLEYIVSSSGIPQQRRSQSEVTNNLAGDVLPGGELHFEIELLQTEFESWRREAADTNSFLTWHESEADVLDEFIEGGIKVAVTVDAYLEGDQPKADIAVFSMNDPDVITFNLPAWTRTLLGAAGM